MNIETFPQGTLLIKRGDRLKGMYVIYRGTVEQIYHGTKIYLGPGCVAGLSDALNEVYESEYSCLEEVMAFPCYYRGVDSLYDIFNKDPVFMFGYAKGAFRQCRDVIEIYEEKIKEAEIFYNFTSEIFTTYMHYAREIEASVGDILTSRNFVKLEYEGQIEPWEKKYIDCLNSVDNKEIENIYGKREDVVIGIIGICCQYMKRAIDIIDQVDDYLDEFSSLLISDEQENLFDLLFDLNKYAYERRISVEIITKLMNKLQDYFVEHDIYNRDLVNKKFNDFDKHDFVKDREDYENAQSQEEEYEDTLGFICEFGGIDLQLTDKLKSSLTVYLSYEDKDSKDEGLRKAKKTITECFYEIYEKVFFKAVRYHQLDPVIDMFLHFGFMSLEATGTELADELLDLTDCLDVFNRNGVVTIFNWLKMVYNGEREPGKNELDLDYRGYLIEERKSGNITEEQQKRLMEDNEEKVKFEIANFFKSANRVTSGKLSSFCPIICRDDFPAEVRRLAVTAEKINKALAAIEDVDFSIFYREQYFHNEEFNIHSEPLMHRVPPDIILLPNAGTRSMLWQECGGIRVNTPGRIVLPLFTIEDVSKMVIYCCGSFRWEICRREQGSRWNDIQSNCLTSDYYDYITFYRKNKDLNQEQKEKVKNLMKSNRNNMREAFTKQYIIWINYEAQGSMRLNKCEREIFCKHIPFAKKYMDAVTEHPMYQDYISRYNVKKGQKLHHTKAVFDKYIKAGGEMTEEIEEGFKFFEL